EDKQTNNNFKISHDGKIAFNLPWMRTLSYVIGYSTQISESHKVAKVETLSGFRPIISSLQTGYFEVPYKTTSFYGSGGVKSNPQDLFFKLSNSFGFKLFNSWTHQMSMGAEYRYEQNKSQGYYNDDPLLPLKTNEDGRPRPYYDIPPVSQASAYLEDKMTWKMLGMKTNLSAGLRFNMLQPGKEEQVSALSPRINASIELSENIELRLGYGQNAKTPGLTHLYPEKKYIDRIAANTAYQLNPAERMVMYHTMVYDVQRSFGLKNAINTKYEIGLDIKLPQDRSINIVAYHDVTPNGFGSHSDYFTYLADYYEIGKGLKYITNQKPILDPTTLPARVDTVYATKGLFGNTEWSRNIGIELDANLGRSEFLNTSFYLSGAYTESSSKSIGLEYGNPKRDPSITWPNYLKDVNTPPFKYIYNDGTRVIYHSSLNSTFRAVTNIPALKMVMSNTIFVSLSSVNWETNTLKIPVGYIIANQNGGFESFEITKEMLDNPDTRIKGHLLSDGIIDNSDKIPTRTDVPIWNISTRLTKEISKVAGFSFFVNNTLFYEPWIHSSTSTTLTQRNLGTFSFGMELFLKL
ncbi:MAG: TonB-dependent receptor domain-containing protein, partial [Paludibacter sp.]